MINRTYGSAQLTVNAAPVTMTQVSTQQWVQDVEALVGYTILAQPYLLNNRVTPIMERCVGKRALVEIQKWIDRNEKGRKGVESMQWEHISTLCPYDSTACQALAHLIRTLPIFSIVADAQMTSGNTTLGAREVSVTLSTTTTIEHFNKQFLAFLSKQNITTVKMLLISKKFINTVDDLAINGVPLSGATAKCIFALMCCFPPLILCLPTRV